MSAICNDVGVIEATISVACDSHVKELVAVEKVFIVVIGECMKFVQMFALSIVCLIIFTSHEAFGAERCEENFRRKIKNQTSGLKLLRARQSGDECVVSLRNDYSKNILVFHAYTYDGIAQATLFVLEEGELSFASG